MIIEVNSRLWYHEPLPGQLDADVLKLMPAGARILTAAEKAQFDAVKVPTVDTPIDVNAANRFEMLTVTDNDLSAVDSIVKLRPFTDISDFQARAGKFVKVDISVIVVGATKAKKQVSASAKVINS